MTAAIRPLFGHKLHGGYSTLHSSPWREVLQIWEVTWLSMSLSDHIPARRVTSEGTSSEPPNYAERCCSASNVGCRELTPILTDYGYIDRLWLYRQTMVILIECAYIDRVWCYKVSRTVCYINYTGFSSTLSSESAVLLTTKLPGRWFIFGPRKLARKADSVASVIFKEVSSNGTCIKKRSVVMYSCHFISRNTFPPKFLRAI